MWTCPKCNERLDGHFEICWRCGTDCRGQEDPTFVAGSAKNEPLNEAYESTGPLIRNDRVRYLVLFVACTVLGYGTIRGATELIVLAVLSIVVSNMSGLIVGVFVTYILGIPNDGTLARESAGRIATSNHGGTPLCLQCLRPVSRLDHFCPHCGQSVGQLAPYLPFESIWFEAGMWGKLWNRLWYKRTDSAANKCLFFLMILLGAPILLLALPTVWWWKSRDRQQP